MNWKLNNIKINIHCGPIKSHPGKFPFVWNRQDMIALNILPLPVPAQDIPE